MIFAAGTPGAYIRDWNTYSDQFREQDVPVTPAYDTIWENLVAYIDGHPVNQSTSTTAASVKKLTQLCQDATPTGSESALTTVWSRSSALASQWLNRSSVDKNSRAAWIRVRQMSQNPRRIRRTG
jgi:hypothetical protein